MGNVIELLVGDTTVLTLIHGENVGAMVPTKTLFPQFSSLCKHYHTKLYWFQEDYKAQNKFLKEWTTHTSL